LNDRAARGVGLQENGMSDEYQDWQAKTVKVVKNPDNVCALWPADRANAPGWEDVGVSGSKDECLQYIRDHCDGNCRLRDQTAD
jgi:MbtH protein